MVEPLFMQYVASVEQYSTHPIAQAILADYEGALLPTDQMEEVLGEGIKAVVDGKVVLVGNHKLFTRYNIAFPVNQAVGTLVYVAIDQQYVGSIVIADSIKKDAKAALQKLKTWS